ncbi:MaoC family dehydratase [Stenotrophomonas maltophilia]|uniref:MaoC family dehydratase n=1 Tax=Stenotrophomonas maltophilia TaxID=40324 RepID=UPI0007F93AE0|nr:MaoC family dehydratase [Stenotrophomonas maltophilia]EKU9978908.1 MaoC family dehydratase [Stenotrophomonas maltophilia]EKX6270908.1 MaoC family dehydratase [Stenotrophomonas maltophilia]MBH1719339.1 MaoC family dehydratase [Stenotrophomonas maltophilia]MBH1793057.1 MaoC family dehydratase [Stenotrophomonas maltophilia]MBH1887347.1 MaoC family dehydratase [Stenotrophomonas maltophilia]
MSADSDRPPALQAVQQWAASERLSGVTCLDQARIDAFADATGDHNWIHVDPARAQAQMPGGRTIAHGFLLLSLTVEDDVAALAGFPGIAHVLNYGLNKVRFLAPVPSGSGVRVRSQLVSLDARQPGQWLLIQRKAVERVADGELALVAEQLSLIVITP